MQKQKKVVIIAGSVSAASAMVLGLVKGGYAVECVPQATDVLDRIGRTRNRCDALVIAQDVAGMAPDHLLQSVLVSDAGCRTPTVVVGDALPERERRQSVVWATNDVGAITDAVDRVLMM